MKYLSTASYYNHDNSSNNFLLINQVLKGFLLENGELWFIMMISIVMVMNFEMIIVGTISTVIYNSFYSY